MGISGSQHALMYARSGLARCGATRSDYYRPFPIVLINGVDKTASTWQRTISIVNVLNEQVDSAALTVFGFDPLPGQTIIIGSGASSNRVFGGTILTSHQRSVKGYAKKIYDLECVDWTWTLNKRRAFKTYPAGTAANVAVVDLVTTYAPTFGTGKVRSGATLSGDMTFRGTPLQEAIQQIAENVRWRTYPDYDKVVHFFSSEADGIPATLGAGNYQFDNLDYVLDLSQIQTRVFGVGSGGTTAAPVAIGATTIPTDECGWYSASGGLVLPRTGDQITYTGVSAASGAGNLTGVSGVLNALNLGDTLNVFTQQDDVPAQTALATLIGGGDDGIREGWVENGNWNLATTIAQAAAQLAAFKSQDVRGSYTTYDKLTKAGKVVPINISQRGINTSVTLQRVTRTLAAPNKWAFAADFSIVWSDLIDILTRNLAA